MSANIRSGYRIRVGNVPVLICEMAFHLTTSSTQYCKTTTPHYTTVPSFPTTVPPVNVHPTTHTRSKHTQTVYSTVYNTSRHASFVLDARCIPPVPRKVFSPSPFELVGRVHDTRHATHVGDGVLGVDVKPQQVANFKRLAVSLRGAVCLCVCVCVWYPMLAHE